MESEEAKLRRQARDRDYYYRHREHRKELSRRYYHEHPEKWKEYHKPRQTKAKVSDNASRLERAKALFRDPSMAAHLQWLVNHAQNKSLKQ